MGAVTRGSSNSFHFDSSHPEDVSTIRPLTMDVGVMMEPCWRVKLRMGGGEHKGLSQRGRRELCVMEPFWRTREPTRRVNLSRGESGREI